jgi:hypothetical protein
MTCSESDVMQHTRKEPVPDSAWTVQLRFSRSTALFSPNASLAESSQKRGLPPIAAYSCSHCSLT